ncbi:MAG: Fe2+-dicitrate sensor protein, partial [Bordetella sp.]|nr:Fe2+-dicitrate sensor protein [Bordetella sp.]
AFAVERGDAGSLVTVLRRTVEVWSQGARVALGAGEALRLDAAGAGEAMAASAWRAAWHDGMLIVRDEPLENVIAALRDYRSGWIRLSPQAARLRVLGAFPLDDTDAALDALAQTLPIVVRRHGGWLVTIDARAA